MKKFFISTLICLLILQNVIAQVAFKTVYGVKAKYSISVPSEYYSKASIGSNVDLKFTNSDGASIVTVITNAPPGTSESDLQQMANAPDRDLIRQLEVTGLENISIINKGPRQINGVNSYYAYYRSRVLYHHVITQLVKGMIFSLAYTCEYRLKDSYLPYINRVSNSLAW